ncbi:MAG TPA: aminotransferase class IV, partial [Pirellulales bacterium]|nr:aminotransferase class IV [Pirellulales bacterium]
AVLHIQPGMAAHELERVTEETLVRNIATELDIVDWNIIHSVSRGPASGFGDAFRHDQQRPTVVVSCFPLTRKLAALERAYEQGLDLVLPAQRAIPGTLLDSSIKTRSRLHYQLANLEAARIAPGSLAVLVDPDGYLTEGTSANVFLVRAGQVLSPEPRNLLPGITRGVVFELAVREHIPVRETNLTPDDATEADEIFLTSTSIGVVHARSFDGKRIGEGGLGPITARLRAALEHEVGVDIAAQARAYAAMLAGR